MEKHWKKEKIMLVDTHAHLQWSSFKPDREKVLNRARRAGVKSIVNIGFNIEACKQGIELAEKHEGLYAAVGVHPHNAKDLDNYVLRELRKLCENRKVVAIGEIGLDYYRNLSPREVQKWAFEAQMKMAKELRLPIIVHDRDAHSDIVEMLSKYSKMRGIMHCFSGSRDMAERCIEMGLYISFAGPVTFNKSHKLREIAANIDLDKILLETDCPWLSPQEVRGKRNEPANLVLIARKIADLRRMTFADLSEATTRNAESIFGISEKNPR